jgi:putative hydrolase
MEEAMEEAVDNLSGGSLDRESLGQLDTTMTAVEGYAELLMDRAFDDEYDDLRAKIDARRQGRGPIAELVRELLGMGMKRQQYERGKAFFDTVADARGVAAAGRVWESPDHLPTDDEIERPQLWIDRIDP